jgi:hypothetical protein
MTRTVWTNPPSTGYKRPKAAKFYVWQDRLLDYSGYGAYRQGRWERHPWRWLCTYCDPPATGFVASKGAFERIMRTSKPRHFEHRRSHHRYVASYRRTHAK